MRTTSHSKGGPIKLIALQLIIVVAVAAYLCQSRVRLRRRNKESWDSLLARLRQDWSARELSDISSPYEGSRISPGEKLRRIRGAHGLWAMYQNAGVMSRIADYAARNSILVDHEVIAGLRRDAMLIRVCVLSMIAKYLLGVAQDSVCINALKIETIFLEIEWRTNEFLQEMAPAIAPAFTVAS